MLDTYTARHVEFNSTPFVSYDALLPPPMLMDNPGYRAYMLLNL